MSKTPSAETKQTRAPKPADPSHDATKLETPETIRTTETSEALPPLVKAKAKEYGGRDGPEPTRYGDWENNGIISDF